MWYAPTYLRLWTSGSPSWPILKSATLRPEERQLASASKEKASIPAHPSPVPLPPPPLQSFLTPQLVAELLLELLSPQPVGHGQGDHLQLSPMLFSPLPLPPRPSGWHLSLSFPGLIWPCGFTSTKADCLPAPLTTLLPRRWLRRAANSASEPDTEYIYFLILEQGTRDCPPGPWVPSQLVPQALPRRLQGDQDARVRGPGCLGRRESGYRAGCARCT